MRLLLTIGLCTIALLSTACDTAPAPDSSPGLLVEAYLYWPSEVHAVVVGRPVPLGGTPDARPANDARVWLGVEQEALAPMTAEGGNDGRYIVDANRVPLEAGAEYALVVEHDGQRLTAFTRVPPPPSGVRMEPDARSEPLDVDRSDEDAEDLIFMTWTLPDGELTPHLIQVDHPEFGRTFASPIHWDGEGTVEREAFPEAGTYRLCLYRTTDDLVTFEQNPQARRLYVVPSNVEGGFGVFAALHGTCWPITVR